MNSRQLQYAVFLSEIMNISQAAQLLGITQPALSKQILSLEKELDVTLFDRNESPLKLTPAGEYFVQNAKDILYREEELYRSMEAFRTGEKGRLVIGISPFKASYFLTDVIKKLHAHFPGLQIVLDEKNSAGLQKDTADGIVDFSILNLPVDDSTFDTFPLEEEKVVLVIPKEFSKKLPSNSNSQISFEDCKEIPFIALSKNQELRVLFDKLCKIENVSLNIATEVVGVTTAYNLACNGVGATLIPLKFAQVTGLDKNVSLYNLKKTGISRSPAIVVKKGRYISEYAKTAMEYIGVK
jgi:DNA-binding transcriptional LysR family regulator